MSARIVVVGGGFAGLSAVRELERSSAAGELSLTLVNRQNFMLFTPMLAEAACGSIEARHIVQPLRAAMVQKRRRPAWTFELGEAIGIDTGRRTVSVRHPLTHECRLLEYDELVLALGATDSAMGVPGVEKHAIAFKTIADAQIVRNRVIGALEVAAKTDALLERDRLLRFVIVGGNFTGVELAGELRAFLRTVLRYYPSVDPAKVEVAVVESSGRLLGDLPAKFGKYAASTLRERGVRLLLSRRVRAVDGRGVELEDGERLASATVLWAAGEEPAPLARQLGLETNERGAIRTAGDLRVVGSPHVWALGDCAAVPRPSGGTYAPLAQNAIREGSLLAANLLAQSRGKRTRPFRYREMGQMASLGNREALAELPGGRMLTGMPAWVLWRTYYLGRLPGWNRKVRVALDWTLGLAFAPQAARLPMVEKGETSFEHGHALSR